MCVAKPENIAGRNPLPLWANIARDRWEWGLWFRADYAWVMRMKYEDPRMEAYFNSLPSKVRAFINNSRADISTPGELMLIGEHFRKSFGEPEEGPGAGTNLFSFGLPRAPMYWCSGAHFTPRENSGFGNDDISGNIPCVRQRFRFPSRGFCCILRKEIPLKSKKGIDNSI